VKVCLASIHPRMLSGQIEALIALRDALEARGHEAQVVSAFRGDQLRQERRWAVDFGDSLALAPKVVRIGRIIDRIASAGRECDVLHFNVPTPAFGVLGDILHLMTRRPVVLGFEAHLAEVPAVARRLRDAPEFYLPRLIVNNGLVARTTLRMSRRFVVSSEFQRRELAAVGYDPRRVAVIPNLIDTHKLRRWDRAEARSALGLTDGPLVAFVGHYHDVKGHDVLIRAFPRVLAQVPDARLVLAWSGIGHQSRVRAAIRAAGIEDRVIELGKLDVSQLFSAADAVALPYRFSIGQAAYPGTVIEAMWVGAPLVTSDLPLLRELSDDGQSALLARPGDAAHLGQQLARVLTEPGLAQALVQAQQRALAERFSTEQITGRYVNIYEEVLAGQAQLLQPARD
jgi:glycosyltransferase involved in cell wall biosynthesis